MDQKETVQIKTRAKTRHCLISRRRFLQVSGATMALITVPGVSQTVWAKSVSYPRSVVARLSQLQVDSPIVIAYPDASSECMLVRLGVPAGGGVGPDSDIVAFSSTCTHMGDTLEDTYNAKHKGLGPCPFHLTRFDLTRHGMVISGHATESLPQVLLEVEGDEIHATGMMGLLYGRAANLG